MKTNSNLTKVKEVAEAALALSPAVALGKYVLDKVMTPDEKHTEIIQKGKDCNAKRIKTKSKKGLGIKVNYDPITNTLNGECFLGHEQDTDVEYK